MLPIGAQMPSEGPGNLANAPQVAILKGSTIRLQSSIPSEPGASRPGRQFSTIRRSMSTIAPPAATNWNDLADRVLDGYQLTAEEAVAILQSPDEELLDLLAAAYRVRRRYFGKTVQLYFLMNAKSGLCPEDCSYCSQSKVSDAEIPRYNLLNREKLLAGAAAAAERQAKTYCIVISARGPNEREIKAIETIVPEIKEKYGL